MCMLMTVVLTISPRSSARLASRCFWSSLRQYVTNSTVDRWASSASDVFLFFWTGGQNEEKDKEAQEKEAPFQRARVIG